MTKNMIYLLFKDGDVVKHFITSHIVSPVVGNLMALKLNTKLKAYVGPAIIKSGLVII